jgi:hypothetical protein
MQDEDMSLEEELKKSKQIQRKISEVVSKTRGTGVQFVLQELAMGIAFAKLSHDSRLSGNTESANRQKVRAREAHETVRRFLPQATPNPEQKKKIEAGLAELDAKIKALRTLASKRAKSGKSVSKNIELSITWELRRGIARANEGLRTTDIALRQELCDAAQSGHQIALQLMAQNALIGNVDIQEKLTLLENLLRKLESDKRSG